MRRWTAILVPDRGIANLHKGCEPSPIAPRPRRAILKAGPSITTSNGLRTNDLSAQLCPVHSARFWQAQADSLAWYRTPSVTLQTHADGTQRWFADGRLNSSYLALDRQIELGRGEQVALIYDSPVTGVAQRFTYSQLRDEVARLAGLLCELGVGKGDGVIIYMPMVPQAAMAMLACARIGAVHSVVFGGFAANELALRIDDARPALVLTASCGLEFVRSGDRIQAAGRSGFVAGPASASARGGVAAISGHGRA